MKYILVTGGVISGVGKGIISSSIGVICQSLQLACTVIKIDPYINIDAGTFSPSEHGEVYVLDDGAEVDLDLGNYERFLGLRLTSEHNLTTGKIFQKVSTAERDGAYLGKTVQFVPHITDAIQDWVSNVATKEIVDAQKQKIQPKICVIELGGTVGDIESMAFIEAFRQFQLKVGPQNFLCVHVSLIVELNNEQKTKPTQRSVGALRSYGLNPDILICRSHHILTTATRSKLAAACTLTDDKVISVPDMQLYSVPLHLVAQGILDIFKKKFNLIGENVQIDLSEWSKLLQAGENASLNLNIALVGKYTKSNDAYASVLKATEHAALSLGAKINWLFIESTHLEEREKEINIDSYNSSWEKLKEASGIIVPGGFDKRGVDGKISAIKYCRINKIPCLGICLGFQLQSIEFARNVIGLNDADSIEFNPQTENPIIIDMPEHNMGRMGATMRLGLKKTTFVKTSFLHSLYKKETIEERHRHRYEVNPDYISRLEDAGMIFVGRSPDDKRMEILELKDHPFFVGVQFHPEFLSRPTKPSPTFVGLISNAIKLHND